MALGKLPRQGSCRGCGGRSGKGLAGGVHFALLLFVSLVLALLCPSSVPLAGALLWYSCASAPSLYPAKCGRRCGSDCPCTSRGVKRRAPTFVHRQYAAEERTAARTLSTIASSSAVGCRPLSEKLCSICAVTAKSLAWAASTCSGRPPSGLRPLTQLQATSVFPQRGRDDATQLR